MRIKEILAILFISLLSGSAYAQYPDCLVLKNGIILKGFITKQRVGKDIAFSIEQTEALLGSCWIKLLDSKEYDVKNLPLEWKSWVTENDKKANEGNLTKTLSLSRVELAIKDVSGKDKDVWCTDSAKIKVLSFLFKNYNHLVHFLEDGDMIRFVDLTPNTYTFKLSEIKSIKYKQRDYDVLNGIIDVVEVKTGKVYKGQIIEKEIGKLVKLKTEDGIIYNISSQEIVSQRKEAWDANSSILEQTKYLDVVNGTRGLIIEQHTLKSDSYILFLDMSNRKRRIELKDVKQIDYVLNPQYTCQTDIIIKNDEVFMNRSKVQPLHCKKDKIRLHLITDSIMNKMQELKIESSPKELVVEMAEKEANKKIFLFPVKMNSQEKEFTYSFEDMLNNYVQVLSQKVTVNKTLRRSFHVIEGTYILYIPKTDKIYLCKVK